MIICAIKIKPRHFLIADFIRMLSLNHFQDFASHFLATDRLYFAQNGSFNYTNFCCRRSDVLIKFETIITCFMFQRLPESEMPQRDDDEMEIAANREITISAFMYMGVSKTFYGEWIENFRFCEIHERVNCFEVMSAYDSK